MVPVWMSRRPRDVPTQRQQRTKAEIFQIRHGTYFSQIVELFRVSVPNARNRRLIVTGATTCRHGTDASSTWFVHAACHKNFLCGRAVRLRVPGVVTVCEESREGRQHSRAEFRQAWPIFAITPPVPSPSSFTMSGCGRCGTRSS